MIIADACYDEMINRIARDIEARVELYEGSTLLETFTHNGALQSFTVERIGDAKKFFGYGICQKAIIKLRDKERAINILKGQKMEIVVGVGCNYLYTCPVFFVEEVKRDENTNELTITAYDALYTARTHTVSELLIGSPYTIEEFTHACAALLGMPVNIDESAKEAFSRVYTTAANFDGSENLREALDDIAEATGTIYYMCRNWCVTFKRLDITGEPVLHIDKSKYFTLTAKTSHTLQNITHTTELSDSVTASTGKEGASQFLRDNAFIELRDDVGDILNELLYNTAGLTITPIECKWRGNFLLECGDKISLTTKDDEIIECFIVDDTFTYNGGLTANTRWYFEDNESETSKNSSNLGDALKQTFARVDKVNRQVELVASEVGDNSEAISTLQVNTNGIMASVAGVEKNVNSTIEGVNDDIETLRKEVEAKISSDEVSIAIRTELSNGVESVKTETGYTFDKDGLHIAKDGEEMQNTLDNTGMYVKRSGENILIANNDGVEALNVIVKTWLIVGENSRFENYGSDRTGCFWIGG